MNYIECIQNSLNYIEKNIKEEITAKDIASESYISYFHFCRIFTAVLGIPISEYLRRRRLSEAAAELLGSNKSIIGIALDYQFDSQETFTRNFKKYFKITPGKLRKLKNKLVLYQKANLYLSLNIKNKKGVISVDTRIEERNLIKMIGMKAWVENATTHIEIPKLWEKYMQKYNEIENKINPNICYEVSSDADKENKGFMDFVGVEVSSFDNVPSEMETKEIPAAKYLVFTHKGKVIEDGKSNMHATYDYIYGKYIPESDYEILEEYAFELYDGERFKGPEDPQGKIDIYIPIK